MPTAALDDTERLLWRTRRICITAEQRPPGALRARVPGASACTPLRARVQRTQEARRQNAFKPTPLEFVGSGTNTANRDALSTQARECAGPNVESQPCGRETPEDPSATPVQVQQARQSGALDASEHEFSFGCSRRPVTPRTLSTLSTPVDPFRPSALFALSVVSPAHCPQKTLRELGALYKSTSQHPCGAQA